MCNCRETIKEKLQELYPTATSISGQYEFLSGRSYSDYEIKFPDKKKASVIPVLHAYCPCCGEKYIGSERKNDHVRE
jgi:hypothetical protein